MPSLPWRGLCRPHGPWVRGWARGPPAKRLPFVWPQARGQQSGAREGSLCSGPPPPLSQDSRRVEESGLGAGSSWVSHWWLPARPPSVCGAGGLRVGRRRLPAGAAPWERRGRPGKGPARLAGPGRCSGRRAAPGEPWEHRLEERLEEGQAALRAAGFSQCPLLSCGLRPLLRVPDSERERPCALEQRGLGPALLPSALRPPWVLPARAHSLGSRQRASAF